MLPGANLGTYLRFGIYFVFIYLCVENKSSRFGWEGLAGRETWGEGHFE